MDNIKVEFVFNTKNAEDEKKLENFIKNLKIVENYEVKRDNYILSIKCTENIDLLKNKIEKETGISTALKGFGDKFSAVSEIHSDSQYKVINETNLSSIIGVIRLTQLNNELCYIDGVVDNLNKNLESSYDLNINEYGDLSGNNFEKIGNSKIKILDKFSLENTSLRFNKIINNCNLKDCIGRSVVLNSFKKPIAAGIIARASPISGNAKKICQCSGKTIWEEKNEFK